MSEPEATGGPPALAADVDPDALDPAQTGEQGRWRRRCVARKLDGTRCGGQARANEQLCNIHSGAADPTTAAHSRANAIARRQAEQERETALARMGTRNVVAQALAEEAVSVDKAVRVLARSAASGDLASARALIPWLNQALGMPTERVEHRTPVAEADISSADLEALTELVAEGRRRLRAVE